MIKREYLKPDGRKLWLYRASGEIVTGDIPSPSNEPVSGSSHMRLHPLLNEWVIYAAHRQNRTFLPPAEYNPLAPTTNWQHPTELPSGNYDVAVFENRFPSLSLTAHTAPYISGVDTQPGKGACEVVVFSQDATATLGGLSVEHIDVLLQVWADRTTALQQAGLSHVMPFENRGVEVGVTLHHPHGQIYAYNHLPPNPKKIQQNLKHLYQQHGKNYSEVLLAQEKQAGERIIYQGQHSLSLVPAFARFPFETWVIPEQAVQYLSDLSPEQRRDYAQTLKDALMRLDQVFECKMPYLLVVQQAPVDGNYPEWFLHIQILPYLRAAGKLKFLAGTETGAGVFASDALPENNAAQLKNLRGAS